METDSAFWRGLRAKFESLALLGEFSLIWTSKQSLGFAGEVLPSQWIWFRFPDHSHRARLIAFAQEGAKAMNAGTQDDWFDALRQADFTEFKVTGRGQLNFVEWESGELVDVVKHSITLCYQMELEAPIGLATGESGIEPAMPIVELVKRIETWRLQAGGDGGKLNQAVVADQIGINERAYRAAKVGKPKAKDHHSKLAKFAEKKGLLPGPKTGRK